MTTRGSIKLFVMTAALAAGAFAAPATRAETLRVCADPDNLPFSKSEGPERGLYIELAEMVAKRLNSPIEYTWWLTHNQRRALRNTILQDGCDAVFALPAEGDYKARGLQRTQPFLQMGYAVVAPPAFVFASLADLKGKRVAVQFMTPPHIFFSQQDGFTVSTWRTAEEVLDTLAKGEADAAIVWGPVAGYENKKRFDSRWKVMPVTGNGMGGQVAVAVRRGKDALKADIDKALSDLQGDINILADKYGFPRGKPIDLERTSSVADGAARVAFVPAGSYAQVTEKKPVVTEKKPEKKKQKQAADPQQQAAVKAAGDVDPVVAEARTRFNDQCSHCHGKDGFSPVSERDLRRLKMRYDEKWPATALATIKNGRQDRGMPSWKDVYNDTQIDGLVGFLKSIQK